MRLQMGFGLNRTNMGLRDLNVVFFEEIFELSPLLATLTHEIAVSPLLAYTSQNRVGWGCRKILKVGNNWDSRSE